MSRAWVALALLLAQPAWSAPDRIEVGQGESWVAGTGELASGNWWSDFDDPALDQILDLALTRNGDVQASFERVRMASGVQMQTFSPLLPQASFEAGLNTGPYTGSFCQQLGQATALQDLFETLATDPQALLNQPPAGAERDLCTSTSAMLVAGWQLDLFGRQSLAYAAQVHEVQATRNDRDAQVLALTTLIAEAWYDVVTSERQVALLEAQLEAQDNLLELIEMRWEQGGATGLDVLQQRQQAASTRALIPTARAGRDARRRQLAAFLGERPENLPTTAPALPRPEAMPGVGRPDQLVRDRPDLVAGEQRALGARDARTSAQLGLLPTLRLSANAGWRGFFDPDGRNNAVLDVMTQTPQWGAGLTLSVPLFNGGFTHGRIRQARAAEAMAVHGYNQSVRNAIAEVDGAIRVDEEQRLRREAVEVQAETASLAYGESVQRYLEGIESYLSVLSSQAAHQAAELALLQARRDAVSARIQLHDALGQIDGR